MIEELADSLYIEDPSAALALYMRADIKEKVCRVLMAKGYYNNLIDYCSHNNLDQNVFHLLRIVVNTDNEKGYLFALELVKIGRYLEDIELLIQPFVELGLYKLTLSILETANLHTNAAKIKNLLKNVAILNNNNNNNNPNSVISVFNNFFGQ